MAIDAQVPASMLFSGKLSLKGVLSDPTMISLLAANIITIILGVIFNWSIMDFLWVYLVQNLIIGLFNFARLITLSLKVRGFSIIGFFLSFFFLFHYGMFHLAYLFFLFTFSFSVGGSFGGAIQNLISFLPFLLLTSIVFFINHLISFVYYYKKEISVEADFWVIHKFMSLMFKPYIRIVPMHLTIIFGGAMLFLGFNQIVLVLFLLLKTFVDLKMHANEHSQN